ncbi:MAG: hypothetical protein M3Z06_04750, partial [Actinomycetota bacterium]|nr:hypothetical protein [Actinomycetota bacterium]
MNKPLPTETLSIARVEPLTRTRAVRGPFDYRLGPEHVGVEVGSVLSVPFGRSRTLGVVLALGDSSEIPPERLAEPLAILTPSLPPDLVVLAGWMAREYCSTPARALSLLLAPGAAAGVRPRTVRIAEITASGRAALGDGSVRLSDGQRESLQRLDGEGTLPTADLGLAVLHRLEARGLVAL